MNPALAVAAFVTFGFVAYVKRDQLAALAVDVRELIKGFEGFSSTPYADDDRSTPGRVEYSYGFGHQLQPGELPGDPEQHLSDDIGDATRVVFRLVRVPLTANQHAALVSFVFNIGATKFSQSTLLRLLNARDYDGAAAEFSRWVYSGGKVNTALVARREREKEIFKS